MLNERLQVQEERQAHRTDLYAQMLLSTCTIPAIYASMTMIGGSEVPTELLQDHAHQGLDHRLTVEQTSVVNSIQNPIIAPKEKGKELILPFDVAFVGGVGH